MTTLDTPRDANADTVTDVDSDADRWPAPRRRRRRPAPKAHAFWRFVFPLLVIAAGVAVLLLWRAGTKSVLDSTDGREVEIVTDPGAPGFVAFVDPTPTLLVAHTDGGELVGVTVMAQTALEQGGQAVLVAADLLVEYEGDGGTQESEFLRTAWESEGLSGVEFLVEQLVGFGFTEMIELDVDNLAIFLGQVDPLPYLLADDLVVESDDGPTLWLEHGRKELDADVAAQIFGFRNPGEPEANRLLRQRRLWDTWLQSIARAEDPVQATLPLQEGLSPYLRSLGVGEDEVVIVPVEPVGLEPESPPHYIVESGSGADWLRDRALEMVPLPISPKSSVRPTVRLLDGTGDSSVRDSAGQEIIVAGGVVSVIGNADAFGVRTTTVLYHRTEVADQARIIAEALGVEAVLDDDIEQPTDITVTTGLDRVES
jgi:hypothetical protein